LNLIKNLIYVIFNLLRSVGHTVLCYVFTKVISCLKTDVFVDELSEEQLQEIDSLGQEIVNLQFESTASKNFFAKGFI